MINYVLYIFVYIYILYFINLYVHDLLTCTLLRSLVAISVYRYLKSFPSWESLSQSWPAQQLATNKALAGMKFEVGTAVIRRFVVPKIFFDLEKK